MTKRSNQIYSGILASSLLSLGFGSACATVYDPAADFEAGWSSNSNPNGVWSYGYSTTPTSTVTLYDAHQTGADSANEQFWISSVQNCCVASPAVGFNDGPAFNNINVAAGAHQIIFVSSVYQTLSSDLVFTAPEAGNYSLTGNFYGSQIGIGVNVAIAANGSIIYSSSVDHAGQIVPFNADVTLSAGEAIVFAVMQGGGNQNAAFDLTISGGVPEASVYEMVLLGFGGLGLIAYRRRNGTCLKVA